MTTKTTTREEIALRLAAIFIRLSKEPLYANLDGDSLSKEDIADTLEKLALRMKDAV